MKRGYWTVLVWCDSDGLFHFNVLATNGKTVAVSHIGGYGSKAAAHRGAWRLIDGLSGHVVVKDQSK